MWGGMVFVHLPVVASQHAWGPTSLLAAAISLLPRPQPHAVRLRRLLATTRAWLRTAERVLADSVKAIPEHSLLQRADGIASSRRVPLLRGASQSPNNLAIRVDESELVVVDAVARAKRLDELTRATQVVPRQSGEEMVLDLELEATVKPVHPFRALDIHARRELAMGRKISGRAGGTDAMGQNCNSVPDS